jgi:hypothetical protein
VSKYRSVVPIAYIAIAGLMGPKFAFAQQTSPHLEACTKWEVSDNKMGFQNNCGQPVTVLFWKFSAQRITERTISPGARFDVNMGGRDATWWMSTRCPAAYSPNVPFILENTQIIVESRYQCKKK